jgi:peroxiredoxin
MTMSIKVGDKLPDATFRVLSAEGPKPVTTSEVFSGKKVALFAVPGAFTPTCSQKHLPSFLAHIDEFTKKGVDAIVCVAVNDPFVLGAWETTSGAKGKVLFLSDGNAEFTKKIGMDFDGSGFGLGTRSKRYSMLVENGVVKAMNVEDSPAACSITGGEALLDAL